MTVVFSKNGANVDAAVMFGSSVSTMLMKVFPSRLPRWLRFQAATLPS